MHTFTFHRKDLATYYCQGLKTPGLTNFRSGLFLTAPRRTGKSTFLVEDFIPQVKKEGWLPISVDLWANKDEDIPALLRGAVQEETRKQSGFFTSFAERSGLTKVSVNHKHISADFEPIKSTGENSTIASQLDILHAKSKKTIVLILDEAQYALESEVGRNSMFALKSARDTLNMGSTTPKLFLVFTGSNRDKLAEIVTRKNQPFFGAAINNFPLLGTDFIASYTAYVNEQVVDDKRFDPAAMEQAFKLLNHKPESLFGVVSQVLGSELTERSQALIMLAKAENNRAVEEVDRRVELLPEIQRAVLQVLLKDGTKFTPFSAESIAKYAHLTAGQRVSVPRVQKALESLREKNFVWKTSYGGYAVDDDNLSDWHQARSVQIVSQTSEAILPGKLAQKGYEDL